MWGRIKLRWIIIKVIIRWRCNVDGVIISGWNNEALSLTVLRGFQVFHNQLYLTDRNLMFLGISFQLLSLSAVIVISVFKPWGQRKRSEKRRIQRLAHDR